MSARTPQGTDTVSRRRGNALRTRVPLLFLALFAALFAAEFFHRKRRDAMSPKILFVVLSGAGWDEIGSQGSDTWHKHVVQPHRLRIASNVCHKSVPESVLLHQPGVDTHKDSQRRFLDVIFNAPMHPSEYLFLVDDDAFVIVPNVERFIKEQILSSQDPNIYGQISCSDLCGGGGALFTPGSLKHLKDSRDAVMREFFDEGSPFDWDVVLSRVISSHRVPKLKMVDRGGNFNSQPPNFYDRYAYAVNSVEAIRQKDLPLTFHYVDQVHQRKYNDTYNCGDCGSLVPRLYETFYLSTGVVA